MKDRVNFHGRRQGEMICLKANMFSDSVWAEALPIELLGGALYVNIRREEPNLILDSKFDSFVLSVIVSRLGVMRLFNIFDQGIVVL